MNRLTKSPASTSLTFGAIAIASFTGSLALIDPALASTFYGAMSGATITNANTIRYQNMDYTAVHVGGKRFDNFIFNIPLDGFVNIGVNPSGHHEFRYTRRELTGPAEFSIAYDIKILDPKKIFWKMGFDTGVNPLEPKELAVATINGGLVTLKSLNGNSDVATIPGGLQKIQVLNTIKLQKLSDFDQIQNTFSHKEKEVQVPEPGTILGLLTLGGLGFLSRFQKQK